MKPVCDEQFQHRLDVVEEFDHDDFLELVVLCCTELFQSIVGAYDLVFGGARNHRVLQKPGKRGHHKVC